MWDSDDRYSGKCTLDSHKSGPKQCSRARDLLYLGKKTAIVTFPRATKVIVVGATWLRRTETVGTRAVFATVSVVNREIRRLDTAAWCRTMSCIRTSSLR